MKPTSLIIKDGKRKIISAINSTELPPCLLKLILQDISLQIDKLCIEEEENDLKEYEKELKKSEKKEGMKKDEEN